VIVDVLDYHMDVGAAVAAPRLHRARPIRERAARKPQGSSRFQVPALFRFA
jgi:gamma-glutamyltranspeptidase